MAEEKKPLSRSEREALIKDKAGWVIVVFAALLAINTYMGGSNSGKILNNTIDANNTWSFYQAKSIKQTLTEMRYDDALAAFQGNQLKKADSDLNTFIRKYPSSPYLPLALFWSGNTKYALKDYNGAITQLQTLITRYPGHQRVPAAILTIGNANLESGKKAVAKKTFTDLIAKFPDSEAAKEAKPIVANIK